MLAFVKCCAKPVVPAILITADDAAVMKVVACNEAVAEQRRRSLQ